MVVDHQVVVEGGGDIIEKTRQKKKAAKINLHAITFVIIIMCTHHSVSGEREREREIYIRHYNNISYYVICV